MLSTSTSLKFPFNSKLLIGIMIALMLVTVSGCKKDRTIDDGRQASEMYADAKRYLESQNWGARYRVVPETVYALSFWPLYRAGTVGTCLLLP